MRILRGRDRSKQGKVMVALPKEGRVVVEGLNIVHKHVRPRRAQQKGQRVSIASPIPIANVQLICPKCKRAARVGIRQEGERRVRVCKKCDASID